MITIESKNLKMFHKLLYRDVYPIKESQKVSLEAFIEKTKFHILAGDIASTLSDIERKWKTRDILIKTIINDQENKKLYTLDFNIGTKNIAEQILAGELSDKTFNSVFCYYLFNFFDLVDKYKKTREHLREIKNFIDLFQSSNKEIVKILTVFINTILEENTITKDWGLRIEIDVNWMCIFYDLDGEIINFENETSQDQSQLRIDAESISDEDFKLLSLDQYDSIKKELTKVSESPNDYPDLISPKFINKVQSDLTENGITFIVAPIQFGKSFILKYLEKAIPNFNFVGLVDDKIIKTTRRQQPIGSLNELYYAWFEMIAHRISATGKGLDHLDKKYIERIWNFKTFESWLIGEIASNDSKVRAFLKCLSKLKKEFNFQKDILISLHLDNIQEYTTANVYQELRKDLINYRNPFSNEFTKIKIVVSTRYFHGISTSHNKRMIRALPYLNDENIKSLLNFFNNEFLNAQIKDRIKNLIKQKTNGYPYFVRRFFLIYVEKRLSKDQTHPLELALAIFDDKKAWIFEQDEKESTYVNELILLANNSDLISTKNFISFIKKDSVFDIDDGWAIKNDFLIQQSGFLNHCKDDATNGFSILKQHIRSYLIDQLS